MVISCAQIGFAMFRNSVMRFVKSGQETLGENQSDDTETMEDFQREILKALWYVFDMLDTAKTGLVHVSQLKVITSALGRHLGFDKAEEILNKDAVTDMTFSKFFNIIKTELIDTQEGLQTNPGDNVHENRLNDILKACWKFCNFDRKHKSTSLTNENCLLLWKMFNFLSEVDDKFEPVFPVVIDPEEAAVLLKDFIDTTGQKNKEWLIKKFIDGMNGMALSFEDFLNVFEKGYVGNLSPSDVALGLSKLRETYLRNILAKGMMWKRGHKVKSWKERWFVLTPTHLRYYISSNEKVLKGSIDFDSTIVVKVQPDRPTTKRNRFIIETSKKPYEISAPDLKTKNEWVSALQLALKWLDKNPNLQLEAARERSAVRAERRRLAAEAEQRHKEEIELLQQRENELDEAKRKRLQDEELLKHHLNKLDEEREAREKAEARVLEEKRLLELEHQRLCELEQINLELKRLLELERQAKHDEEIIRNLQAKLLDEELEKREELERLKQHQEEILKSEREQKAVLESDKTEQERRLREAMQKLEQLEKDQAAAATKLQEASEKLQRAEKDRQKMEDKEKLWKTPVGLARLIQPKVDPLISHRGKGAFCEKDFPKIIPINKATNASDEENYDSGNSTLKPAKINAKNSNTAVDNPAHSEKPPLEEIIKAVDMESGNMIKVSENHADLICGSRILKTETMSTENSHISDVHNKDKIVENVLTDKYENYIGTDIVKHIHDDNDCKRNDDNVDGESRRDLSYETYQVNITDNNSSNASVDESDDNNEKSGDNYTGNGDLNILSNPFYSFCNN